LIKQLRDNKKKI